MLLSNVDDHAGSFFTQALSSCRLFLLTTHRWLAAVALVLERPAAVFCDGGPFLFHTSTSGPLTVSVSSWSLTALLMDLKLCTAHLRLLGGQVSRDRSIRRLTESSSSSYDFSVLPCCILCFLPYLLTAVEVNLHQRQRGQL